MAHVGNVFIYLFFWFIVNSSVREAMLFSAERSRELLFILKYFVLR